MKVIIVNILITTTHYRMWVEICFYILLKVFNLIEIIRK